VECRTADCLELCRLYRIKDFKRVLTGSVSAEKVSAIVLLRVNNSSSDYRSRNFTKLTTLSVTKLQFGCNRQTFTPNRNHQINRDTAYPKFRYSVRRYDVIVSIRNDISTFRYINHLHNHKETYNVQCARHRLK